MILFLIKKTFFDMWDNLLSIFLLNLGALLVIAGGLYLISFTISATNHPLAFLGAAFVGVLVLCLYAGVVAMMARDMANYQSPEFQNLIPYLQETWKASTALALLILAQLILVFVIRWYLDLGNFVGLGIASLLFWVNLTWWLASQYYFPIRTQLDSDLKKIVRKCFIFFFDNTLFSIGLALGAIVIIGLSSLVMFLLPGLTGLLLWYQAALKLRMYKYDYLENTAQANRKKIPWNDLLAEERDRVGPRSLRGMIFPWKE